MAMWLDLDSYFHYLTGWKYVINPKWCFISTCGRLEEQASSASTYVTKRRHLVAECSSAGGKLAFMDKLFPSLNHVGAINGLGCLELKHYRKIRK